MGKRIAAAGMAVALSVGGLTIAALNPIAVAGAQGDAPTTAPTGTTGTKEGPMHRALDKLVADGTLTQAQADAVISTTKAEVKAGQAERKERRQANRAELVKTVATAIGTTPEKVKAGLKAGTSIAKQAEAAGVDRQVVDDAVTKLLTDRIDAAVADGRLSADQAAKAKAHVDQAVDRILDADGKGGAGGTGRLRQRLRDRLGN